MLLLVVRAFYAALLIGVGLFAFNLFEEATLETGDGFRTGLLAGGAVFVLGGLVLFLDVRQRNKEIAGISAIFFGLMMGMLLGWLLAAALAPVAEAAFSDLTGGQRDRLLLLSRLVLTVLACYVTISTLVQTKDDFRFIIPYVEFSKQVRGGRPLVLDTSVIIDGRIADLCDTRIIDTTLVVPRFVLQELQGIADSSEKLKRNRGRRGLDVLKRLQTNPRIDLEMNDGELGRPAEKVRVDERLVLFAKALGGRVVTNDFNLNKVAQLQGVDVINLNEVTNALKSVALPGEFLQVRLVKAGDQIGQGVGYLDDGTMIVVEQGKALIGQEVSIVVTSVLQTPAGRMIFGRPENRPPSGAFLPVTPRSSGTHKPVPGPGTGPATRAGQARVEPEPQRPPADVIRGPGTTSPPEAPP